MTTTTQSNTHHQKQPYDFARDGERRAPSDPNQMFTTRQAADLLSISYDMLKKGREGKNNVAIPFVRLGSSVRYRRKDISSYLDDMTFPYNSEAKVMLESA